MHGQIALDKDHKQIIANAKKNLKVSSLDKEEEKSTKLKSSARKTSASPKASATKKLLFKVWVEPSTHKELMSHDKNKF